MDVRLLSAHDGSVDWTPLWAVIGALIGAGASIAGAVVTQRETLKRERELHLWQQKSQEYIDLVSWTAWVQHWYLVGAPDPHERPYTVNMARIAAKIRAFGDEETGAKAFQLLDELRPHVSSQDISGKPPPPGHINVLADELASLARERLAGGAAETHR